MAGKTAKKRPMRFQDRLSRLTYHQACQLLGDDGAKLFGGAKDFIEIDPDEHVYLGNDLLRVNVLHANPDEPNAIVIITQMSTRKKEFVVSCDQCEDHCAHMGAALKFLLDEKSLLGLAAPPDESVPFELLTREELIARALDERKQRASAERMRLKALNPKSPWGEYLLTSLQSGKTYRVALLGDEPDQSYCSCPDFRTNRLQTCKHILYASQRVKQRFNQSQLSKPYRHKKVSLYLHYGETIGVRFHLPDDADVAVTKLVAEYVDETLSDSQLAVQLLRKLQKKGFDVLVYPDAESWVERQLTQQSLKEYTDEIRKDPENHPLRTELLDATLLPYQMDGIAFAVGAGRSVLADDMGLGKTIQGIGIAELLAKKSGISKVLVVCPASLKSQWRDEIYRFSGRTVQLILGRADEREKQYSSDCFFTICNYEQILRDHTTIEKVDWDLIILDEGQRIKNWESKTSQLIRSLQSRFAVVLSGTPLENRLDELYTVCGFIDAHCLGPAYEFFNRHRIVSDTGRVEGIRHLNEVREKLKPILLRRTRAQVMSDLPERTTEIVKIRPTEEQVELHSGFMKTVTRIVHKPYLTEMDLLQLQRSLLMCRMTADSTYLINQEEPAYSTKLDRLEELLWELSEYPDRKIIIFSEWRRMLTLIEPILDATGMNFVRLDGQVPQKKRAAIVHEFQNEDDCRVILMSNAGSTGLNLQAANTVINVDLPWNPAVLEQRVARAHRMGQKNPVHVYLMVTEETLEENLLNTLAMKQDLAIAALDVDSDVNEVMLESGMEELKRRLEQLLGKQPDAPIDQSQQTQMEAEAKQLVDRRERVAAAGGQLMGAALQMVGELLSDGNQPDPDPQVVQQLQTNLATCVERDETGRPQLRISLENDEALAGLAETLARLLVGKPAS